MEKMETKRKYFSMHTIFWIKRFEKDIGYKTMGVK
jgi:hypothetical protein